jgi:nitrate reductase (cytochrome), electron transfer subunit
MPNSIYWGFTRACGMAGYALSLFFFFVACTAPSKVHVPGRDRAFKTAATERAKRRAYDGAPPTIPHQEMGADCISCHNVRGMEVEGLGFSPAMPHERTLGLSTSSRCRQCHVYATTTELFRESSFVGIAQDLRHGERFYQGAPPVIPHPLQLRENCEACHSGPAAREEIRTSHPDRPRCLQCHAQSYSTATFSR